ncbi:MAG: transposase [Candidatus Parvarchaeota archaeon]|jgi:hypothetical protein|nr:transposase [Candidatus Parvarchaeota archaeon]MCL5101111.1 transposase [Candidatus Parvarchaeota archaeon]
MNEEELKRELFRTTKTMDLFVDMALDLDEAKGLSGFHYDRDLLKAAMADTYVETVGDLADSLHLAIKRADVEEIYAAYLKNLEVVGRKAALAEREVILAFDYTEEDFYGEVGGRWIHGWTGEDAVTGKFKFLTCAMVGYDTPEKIPLLTIPVEMGGFMARDVIFCLSLVKPLVKSIKLVLFDRGFYSRELLWALDKADYPYLIFVPKKENIKKELEKMETAQRLKLRHCFSFTDGDGKTKEGETTLALLKRIADPSNGKKYDWCFATSESAIDLECIIQTYKQRWGIETEFRVQDEARIKSKSTDIKIRFFYFVYGQFLQMVWNVIYKKEMGFKRFVIELYEMSNAKVEKAEKKRT